MIGAPTASAPLEPRVVLRRRGEQDRAGHLLEVAAGDRRVGVVRGDDLALLGQLEPAVDRARRLAEDRPVRRAAAAADRAAAAVEQGQLDALARAATSTSAACARWSIQAAARNPDSLFESE